jgi:hypothetical protein
LTIVGNDFSDYVEFASENYGDGSLADTNNNNLGNTPAERQRNQKLVNNNNQDYAKIDKSKGEDVVLWVGVDTWVLVVYCMAGFMS